MVLFFSQQYVFFWRSREGPSRGGGGVLPYISHTGYVLPHRVGFLRRIGLKTGIHFAHFNLESGIVFEGTMECMNVLLPFQFQMSKKERETCKFEMDWNSFFVCTII